ncbi:glycosyltransferase family 1 protein [Pantoea cypripedii]|uniref:glycosyltransferase family 4 protein n=1 Tax=Pantoea cypripedii TaxID=55209 RepID=UPI002FCA599A
MRKIVFDKRWEGGHGIGRFSSEITKRIEFDKYIKVSIKPTKPIDIFVTPWFLMFNKSLYFTPGFNAPWFFVKRSIITIHDLNHIDIDGNDSFLKNIYYNLILKRACRKAKLIFTVSEFSKKRISDWAQVPSDKIVVVGNGVSSEYNPYGEIYRPGFEYFLCVSNRKPHKNEMRLITAFSTIKNRNGIKLLLTGKMSEQLKKHIDSLGLVEEVIFTGYIDEIKLPSYYRGAKALLMPSLYEGFGLPVIEAMACGVPTLASNTTALKEIAENFSVQVNPESVSDIANGIEKLINDADLNANLCIGGLNNSGKYTWENTVNIIVKSLKGLS